MFKKLSKISLSLLMVLSLALGNVSLVKANELDELAQIQLIKDRLKSYFLELDTIDDGAKVETCYVSKAENYLKLIRDDGSFADVNYYSTANAANGKAWDPYLALDRLQAIAIAYHKVGNELYHKEEVITKLNQAIVHWNSIESGLDKPLKGPRSKNWWENQVGVQLRFSRMALFMEDIMSDEAMNIMLTKLIEKTPVKYGTGQNNLWFDQNHVYYALLTKNADKLHDMVDNYLNYCLVTQLDDNTSEAVQVDNSFYMHGRQFYSNGYGMSMFRDMSFWIYMLRNTDFALSQDVMDRMADYMLDGTSWTIRGDIMELYLGYRPYSYDVGYKNYADAYIAPLQRMVASDTKNADRYQQVLNNIVNPSQSNGKNGNYYMWRSGYASHMRDGYGVNIKMDSKNIIGGEWRGSTNSYGQLIYWTSSATSTITVDGNEYTNVFPVYDWAHCPGATTPARIVQDFSNYGRFTNGTDHTIGVTNGKYGSTAYVMNKKDTQATKGYFFFDDEFVALGAGITSKETTAIHTTLNQCEANQVQVNDTAVDQGTNQDYNDVRYIYNDKIGYVFLNNTTVHVSNEKINSTNSLWDESKQQSSSPVFKAYINHGIQPVNDSYAYIVVPNKSVGEVSTYASHIPVAIVKNTEDVQAVRHDGLKQTQIHFYKAGSLEYKKGYTVTVDQPCSIIIDESAGTRKITLAVNDQQDHQTVNVKLSYGSTKSTTTFVSSALPYAGQSMTLSEGSDDRCRASSYTENHEAQYVCDGNETTYWESETNGEQWITIFTGTNQFIKSMDITWGENYASEYDVYISQDGDDYELIHSVTNGQEQSENVPITAICHYVKIVMKDGNSSHYQIKEITFKPSKLLSLNKKTETSSVSDKAPTYVGELAVDGDLNTRWASLRNSDDNWITIDLGKQANIDAVEIHWESACSDNYQIEISDDNENWTTVKKGLKTNASLSDSICFDETITGRYVKIHSLKSRIVSGVNYGINIFEIKIYGAFKHSEENIALNKKTETSSVSTYNETAKQMVGACAVDGNKTGNSRWASLRNSDNNWITIDLGKQAEIDDIIIYWEGACSDNYQIEISDDNENWKVIQSELKTDTTLCDKISFEDSISTRYVKIHSLKSRNVKYGINIYEIEVYGRYLEEDIPEINIALNKPATASSVYQGYVAERAFDGSVSGTGSAQSRWVSLRTKENGNTAKTQYIYVDLEDYYKISKVVLNWEGACGKEYKLQVSTDGKVWTDIEHVTDGKAGIITFTYDEDIIARYVRMEGIEPIGQYGYSLWEFEVYGEITELPEVNIALNKPSVASSEFIDTKDGNKQYYASLAFDGRRDKIDGKASRWVSLRTKENGESAKSQYIYVDLQDYYDLSKVVLNWEGWAATEYKLQVSTNGETWSDIAHITDGKSPNDKGYIKEFTFDDSIIARYVRMEGIEPGSIYGYSLWEFEVYGDLLTKDVLKTIYDQYQEKDMSSYTPASVAVYEGALNNLNVLYNGENVSREEIVIAIELFRSSLNQLVEKADKTALKIVIDQANSIDKSLYTPHSIETLNTILSEVQVIYDDDNATPLEVEAAVNKLQTILNSLTRKANKEGLKKVIDNAKNINEDLYKPSSVASLKSVLEEVEKIYKDDNATESEVELAVQQLQEAYQSLLVRADNSTLKKTIEEAETKDKTQYTTQSYQALEEAIAKAKTVVDNKEATEDEVKEAVESLNKAIQKLVLIERDALVDLLKEVKGKDLTKYTEESVKSLQKAVDNAEKVLESTDQDVIDKAYKELKDALDAIILKGNTDYDIPTIDNDKPVKDITVGVEDINKVKDIIADNISKELQIKIDEKMSEGQNVNTVVSIETIDETKVNNIIKSDIEKIAQFVNKESMKLAQYFDITIQVVAGDEELGKVTETNKQLTFKIAIPEELQKEGRIFKVVRIHDGKVTVLDAKEENGILTFESNQFSTYALTYTDKVETTITPNPTPNPGAETDSNSEAVNTGDQNTLGLYVGMGMLSLLGVAMLLSRKREEN